MAKFTVKWLEAHPRVDRVYYPGLPSHPNHAVAKKQMRAGGGMVSVELKATVAQAKKVCSSFGVFSLAESLGGVESLIEHPAIMTHASVPEAMRAELGISDSLVRLSVGVEHVEDLWKDLEHGLSKA